MFRAQKNKPKRKQQMNKKEKRITTIGGQALIEGIMMRGPKKTYIVVRNTQGEIISEEYKFTPIKEKHAVLGMPFIRGSVSFIESMKMGYSTLLRSLDLSGFAEEEEESKFDKWISDKLGDKMNAVIMGIGGVLGVGLAVLLFFLLPTVISNLLINLFGERFGPWRSVAEGVMRIGIFLSYVAACSLMKDIKRVFMYHGAEHKTIFCYEANEELTVENVKRHSRFHPRCGTSFMVIILLLGIIVGFFIPFTNPFLRTGVKILTIPIVVGIGYELIKLCGKFSNIFTSIISAPGKWVQRITTKEPDEKMIEVAIEALKRVIPENGEDLL